MKRLWITVLAAVFVLGVVVPAIAAQGEPPGKVKQGPAVQEQTCLTGEDTQSRTMVRNNVRAAQGKGAGCRLVVNNRECAFGDVQPVVKSGRMLVPVRAVTEALGATVQWNQQTQTVTVSLGDKVLTLRLQERVALVNGKEITLDVPAQSEKGRAVVPLRFIAQALGYHVGYDNTTGTVTVESPEPVTENTATATQETTVTVTP